MTPEAPRARRILDRPGRVAAIGGAAVVCVLSISGAIGLSHSGSDSGPKGQQPADVAADIGVTGSTGSTDAWVAGDTSGASGTAPGSGGHDSSAGGSTVGDTKSATETTQSSKLPSHSGTGKRVVFDQSAQRVWLVNADDSVDRTYLVSGSKFDNLDKGTYHVYSRSRYATAYNSDETMNYMVRFAQGRTSPIGFHSIPAMPDGSLVESRAELGAPASDGCIRQWIVDARALWNFTPDGTTVVVRT